MKVMLMEAPAFAEELCGAAAAVCTNSDNNERSLRHAMDSGHTSVLEHASYTFKVEGLSRAALAQLTRHRLASFDVQSQRYVRLDNPELVIPETVRNSRYAAEVESTMRYVMNLYQRMVDARYVTPQAVPTALIMTMNARELLHFFSLRTCNRAQWEIRELADKVLKICKEVSPGIFKKAGPGCVTDICPEKRSCGHPRSQDDWDG